METIKTTGKTIVCKLCYKEGPQATMRSGCPIPICVECKKKEDDALLGRSKLTAEVMKRFFPET